MHSNRHHLRVTMHQPSSPSSSSPSGAVDPGLTLVTAGTGKTGRRVAEGLRDLGVDVRIGARSAEPRFDWTDASTWPTALAGVQSVYLAYSPDLAVPGAADHVRAFTALAARSGVRRLVLLSGRGEDLAEASEQIVRESGISFAIVRAAWFAQNFSEDFMLDGVRDGALALPGTEAAEPFVDARDIADVAVAALTRAGHDGALYEVTGPELFTMEGAVGVIAEALGRPVDYVPVPIAAYRETLVELGHPPVVIDLVDLLFTEVMDGRNASTTDAVERVLGRPARRFADYAREAAAAGAWERVATPASA